MSNFFY